MLAKKQEDNKKLLWWANLMLYLNAENGFVNYFEIQNGSINLLLR